MSLCKSTKIQYWYKIMQIDFLLTLNGIEYVIMSPQLTPWRIGDDYQNLSVADPGFPVGGAWTS